MNSILNKTPSNWKNYNIYIWKTNKTIKFLKVLETVIKF